jgi:hypothetical protein
VNVNHGFAIISSAALEVVNEQRDEIAQSKATMMATSGFRAGWRVDCARLGSEWLTPILHVPQIKVLETSAIS